MYGHTTGPFTGSLTSEPLSGLNQAPRIPLVAPRLVSFNHIAETGVQQISSLKSRPLNVTDA